MDETKSFMALGVVLLNVVPEIHIYLYIWYNDNSNDSLGVALLY